MPYESEETQEKKQEETQEEELMGSALKNKRLREAKEKSGN